MAHPLESLVSFGTAYARTANQNRIRREKSKKSSLPIYPAGRCIMQNNLEAALEYRRKGFSVIPIRPDKKPFISWLEFQDRQPTEDEINQWWNKWPKANVGIVTGEISGVLVIDCDNEAAYQKIQEMLPDSFITCIAKTPRGYHLYLIYPKGQTIGNATGIFEGVDVRGNGGYIIAPPSVNAEGKAYSWMPGLAMGEVEPATVPNNINKYLYIYKGSKENVRPNANSLQFLTSGTWDNDFFHIANCMVKGGAEKFVIEQVLERIILSGGEKPEKKWIDAKIKSALDRAERKERNLTEDLRRWIDLTSAYFSLTEAYDPLQILTSQKNTVHQIMHRFCKDGYVERHPNKNGIYRRIDREIEFMDFANADIENHIDLSLPLGLHIKTKIFPKGVIVVAGVSGTGKTLFAFNAIAENMGRFPIFYFNSEMGPEALKMKLSHFPISITDWNKNMKVVDKWDFNNIADKIQPDAFNVVDYLEPEGEKAFNIHGVISAIIKRLNKGTALITIQKKPAATMGTGGIYSIKAATLAIALDWGKIEIVKNRFREADMKCIKDMNL